MRDQKRLTFNRQRGDTMVEVLIAITVLGIVVAGCLSVMNRSLVSIINSSERTAVRTRINSQAAMLHQIRDRDSETWKKIKNLAVTATSAREIPSEVSTDCKLNPNGRSGSSTKGSFYLESHDTTDTNNNTTMILSGVTLREDLKDNAESSENPQRNGKNLSGAAVPGAGIWIDAVHYKNVNLPYFDFYIKACWTPLGSLPDQNSSTVIRIYDGNN